MTPTPGYRSSEFYLTLLVHALTFLVQADVLGKDTPWAKVASLLLSALAQYGYTASRGAVKAAHAAASGANAAAPTGLKVALPSKATSTVGAWLLMALTLSTFSGCAWWNAKGKTEAATVAKCMEGDLLSQWQTLLAQIMAGNLAAVATVGVDVLNCALLAAQSQTAPTGATVATAKQSAHGVAAGILKAEIAKRKTVK
jgi:hypothetical protein